MKPVIKVILKNTKKNNETRSIEFYAKKNQKECGFIGKTRKTHCCVASIKMSKKFLDKIHYRV